MFYRCIYSSVYKVPHIVCSLIGYWSKVEVYSKVLMVLLGWVVDFDLGSKNEFSFQNAVVVVT